MNPRDVLAAKWYELGPFLQMRFWKPLRNMMEIFHLLPLAAAVGCFIVFAVDGQFREIYISYLEVPTGSLKAWLAGLLAAAASLALLSAMLYEAHFALSTLRISVVYSGYSNPETKSNPHSLQRSAAFLLALLPWLGIAIGLLNARNFVADRYCQLLSQMPPDQLHMMQHLLLPDGWGIAAALIALGAAVAAFSCVDQKTRSAQRMVALLAPSLYVLLFLLFTDWLVPELTDWTSILLCAVTLIITVLYFIVYQWLYERRRGPFFTRTPGKSADEPDIEPPISVPQTRTELLRTWALSLLWFLINNPKLSVGVSFAQRQRQPLILWAFMPWFFLATYFAIVQLVAPSNQLADVWATSPAAAGSQPRSLCPIAGTHLPVPGHWTIFPVAMCCTVALGLFTVLFLSRTSEQWRWRGVVIRRGFAILCLIALFAAANKALSFYGVDTVVRVDRIVGPIATMTLQTLFLISIFAVLAWLSQRSGFPVLTLVILAIVACVMFPNHVGLVAILLALVSLGFAVAAFLARFIAVGVVALGLIFLGFTEWYELRGDVVKQISPAATGAAIDTQSVKFEYECWLRQRGISVADSSGNTQLAQLCPEKQPAAAPTDANAQQPYEVYIIAAEGGGIYAASAAAMLFARLQDSSPHFAEHVFAISGVSGGAIGSTVFQALDEAAAQNGAAKAVAGPQAAACAKRFAGTPESNQRGALEDTVTCIMEDDHFSPVVGSIFPELTGSLTGRAEALTASFDDSVSAYDTAAGRALHHPFGRAWSFSSPAPALVLNATWVETGFRVAFAPFHLHNIDESLYSFSDSSMPDESREQLMDAAVVSARFPLILPPFSAVMPAATSGSRDFKRWNFVDGGYSDNSGATTALDLYTVLNTVKTSGPRAVHVQVILLTSSQPQPDLQGATISGTAFRDTMGPIDALMSVRRDLANQAVARACSQIYPSAGGFERSGSAESSHDISDAEANERCAKRAGDPAAALQIVEIQDQTYGLSLGWKISHTSFDVISWMLGDPDECPASQRQQAGAGSPDRNTNDSAQTASAGTGSGPANSTPGTGNSQLTKIILDRNSCVLQSIIKAVAS